MSNLQVQGGMGAPGEGCPGPVPQSHGAHAGPTPRSVTETGASCPYADKAIHESNTASIILMFLRDLLEQETLYAPALSSHHCPMIKCYQSFADPMTLVQHVLACSELPGGEFHCWKCLSWHQLPAGAKEWSDGVAWKSEAQPPVGFPPKRSLSIKMKDTFFPRRPSSRKLVTGSPTRQDIEMSYETDERAEFDVPSAMDSMPYCRPATQDIAMNHQREFIPPFSNFSKVGKSSSSPLMNVDMMWPDLASETMCQHPSTTSSSSFESVHVPAPHARPMGPGLEQRRNESMVPPEFVSAPKQLVSPPPPYQNWQQIPPPPPFHCFPPASQPIGISSPLLSAAMGSINTAQHVQPQVRMNLANSVEDKGPAWGGFRAGDLARVSPVSWRDSGSDQSILTASPNSVQDPSRNYDPFIMCPPIHAPIPRTMAASMPLSGSLNITPNLSTAGSSQETFHPSPVSGLYTTPPTVQQVPHPMEIDAPASRAASPAPSEEDPDQVDGSDDLICDLCQWRPRGVKENLKGYLRKHKNVHKGLRLACDYPGCKKTFSRLDNLKKHRREKHGLDESGGPQTVRRIDDVRSHFHTHSHTHLRHDQPPAPPMFSADPVSRERRDSAEHNRTVLGDHSVLWAGLHL